MNSNSVIPTSILVFLKSPVPGTVKTRLAKTIGASQATQIYKTLVISQLSRLPKNSQVEIHYAPSEANYSFRKWLGPGFAYFPQVEGNLGDRMRTAISSAFERGAREVICIGADCPSLLQIHFEQTQDYLSNEKDDLVIGPANDGGYYMIGLRRNIVGLFDGVRWSSDHTLEDTLRNARKANLRVRLLETMNDIDTLQDLRLAIEEGHLPPMRLPPEFISNVIQ